MIDRERMLQHVDDPTLKQVLVKVLDKAAGVLRKHRSIATDFLSPPQIKAAMDLLARIEGIHCFVTGGYDQAERQLIVVFPDYLLPQDIEIPIKALEAKGSTQFQQVTHRDYLGAILGLGIKREKIGDLLLHQEEGRHFCHLLVHEELKDFIYFHLKKVGNVTVTVQEIPLTGIKPQVNRYETSAGTVASLRLDSVIAMGFRVSRSDAQQLVSRELVSVNWGPAAKGAYEIAIGDLITVRGKGRMEITSIEGSTRSGRIKINYRKPI